MMKPAEGFKNAIIIAVLLWLIISMALCSSAKAETIEIVKTKKALIILETEPVQEGVYMMAYKLAEHPGFTTVYYATFSNNCRTMTLLGKIIFYEGEVVQDIRTYDEDSRPSTVMPMSTARKICKRIQ